MDTSRLRSYAELTLKVGANLQPGQVLGIKCFHEHAPLARAITEVAYEMGARFVDIWYWDPHTKRARVEHAPQDSLDWTPPWLHARQEWLVENRGALVQITGDPEPDLMAGLDPKRAGADAMPRLRSVIELVHSGKVNWTYVACASPGWAEAVYGEPDVERLWDDLFGFMRLDQSDPMAAWKEHIERLNVRANAMNAAGFDGIRFRGGGTDLFVGLVEQHEWCAATMHTVDTGIEYLANMPTEEVFTTPDRRRVEGTVRATRPLALAGSVIEGIEVDFSGGVATAIRASKGKEIVEGEMAKEGGNMLGEVALVDGSSPIGQKKKTYFDILLDENATCHIAYGAGYPQGVKGGDAMSHEELAELGVNHSTVHTDFMVGGPEVEVYGVDKDGREVPVIIDDTWQL